MNVKAHIKQALGSLGYYRDRLARAPYPGVAVLVYHGVRDDRWPAASMHFEPLHVTESELDAHCRVLRDLDCTPLSLADWQAIAEGRRGLPARAVLLTFDDGYRNVLTRGLPVLERHAMPAAVFVATDAVRRQVRFWFDAIAATAGEAAAEDLKRADYVEWRACVERAEMRVDPAETHAPLSPDEVATLAAHPLMTIGAHTDRHPILANASIEDQRAEVDASRTSLESWIGAPVETFAYPNGRPRVDYTSETVDLLRAAGFRHAFAVTQAFADPAGPPFDHPRFLMLSGVDAAELAHRLAVSWPRA